MSILYMHSDDSYTISTYFIKQTNNKEKQKIKIKNKTKKENKEEEKRNASPI